MIEACVRACVSVCFASNLLNILLHFLEISSICDFKGNFQLWFITLFFFVVAFFRRLTNYLRNRSQCRGSPWSSSLSDDRRCWSSRARWTWTRCARRAYSSRRTPDTSAMPRGRAPARSPPSDRPLQIVQQQKSAKNYSSSRKLMRTKIPFWRTKAKKNYRIKLINASVTITMNSSIGMQ